MMFMAAAFCGHQSVSPPHPYLTNCLPDTYRLELRDGFVGLLLLRLIPGTLLRGLGSLHDAVSYDLA